MAELTVLFIFPPAPLWCAKSEKFFYEFTSKVVWGRGRDIDRLRRNRTEAFIGILLQVSVVKISSKPMMINKSRLFLD